MGTDAFGLAPLNLLVLVLLYGLVLLIDWPTPWRRPAAVKAQFNPPRPLKPKSGDDCPLCQAEQSSKVNEDEPRVMPRPWSEGRSPRGRKKEIATHGFACPNPQCLYYGLTDETIHALVGYGGHGKYERIQDLWCQACGHKFTVRRNTVLYRLKTHSARVAEALTFLAEGVDVSVLERVWGVGEGTLRTWLTRAGLHARKLHARFFRELTFLHIQLDELWANVRQAGQEVWVWAAMEVTTKVVPVIQLGPRTSELAYAVVHELCHQMKPGHPLPVFSSDGLRLYFYALTAHCGHWLPAEKSRKRVWQLAADFIYGQVKKLQRRRRLVKVKRVMLWGEFELLKSRLKAAGLTGRINTAFIERLNLTLRQGVALLTRRTWSTAQQMSELALHVDWWRAYYHFARYHEALRVELAQQTKRLGQRISRRYRNRTPAMAAELVSHRWTVLEVISYPLF